MWVKAAEVRPGNPKAVHHMKAWIRPPNSNWMKMRRKGSLFARRAAPRAPMRGPRRRFQRRAIRRCRTSSRSTTRASKDRSSPPATPRIHRGRFRHRLRGALHGDRQARNRSIRCRHRPRGRTPRQRHLTTTAIGAARFRDSRRRAESRSPRRDVVNEPAKLVWIQPHMHYRATYYEATVVYPSGEEKVVLRVPNYRFDWQVGDDSRSRSSCRRARN